MLSIQQATTAVQTLAEPSIRQEASASASASAQLSASDLSQITASSSVSISSTAMVLAAADSAVQALATADQASQDAEFLNNSLSMLRSHDPQQKSNSKSRSSLKLPKFESLLTLMLRWEAQREAQKPGTASAALSQQRLKALDQLSELMP